MTTAPAFATRAAGTRTFEDLPHTCRCGARWSGSATCHCGACHTTFGGIGAFDLHRRGGRCAHPASLGLTLLPGRAYDAWGSPAADVIPEDVSAGQRG
jgi:hypothetical protein